MKNKFLYCFAISLMIATNMLAQDSWTQLPDFPDIGRYGSVAVGIGNKGYMGLGASDIYYSDFWEFDPANNSWTQKADFPGGARQAGIAFSVGNKAYVGTGITAPYIIFSDMYEYDPALNTWTQKANYGGGGRYTAMAFSIGNKGYLGGGKDAGFTYGTNDFWEYDPATDSWTQKANIGNILRSAGVGFSVSGKGYIGLGLQDYDTRLKDLLEYDPITDNWTRKTDFPATERYGSIAFTLCNKAYVGAGYYYSPFNDMWEYDPSTDSWTQKASISNTGRGQGISFSIGNKAYVGFGYNSSIVLNDLWEYASGVSVNCPPSQTFCYNNNNSYPIPALTITSNCGVQRIAYSINGATTRNGSGSDASGTFNPGVSIINWTVVFVDGSSSECQTEVRINLPLKVIVPDVYPLLHWGQVNTLYVGFGPVCTRITAIAFGGTRLPSNTYTYSWSTGETTNSINICPPTAGTYIYSVTITDSLGCQVTASKTIRVIDVRCGPHLNKVLVCVPGKHGNTEACVTQGQAVLVLLFGGKLGSCNSNEEIITGNGNNKGGELARDITSKIAAYPNPSSGSFTIQLDNFISGEIRVLDQNGKIVSSKIVSGLGKSQKVAMNINGVAKGLYVVQAIGKDGIISCKMIIR